MMVYDHFSILLRTILFFGSIFGHNHMARNEKVQEIFHQGGWLSETAQITIKLDQRIQR
jgi:hypothetical protein